MFQLKISDMIDLCDIALNEPLTRDFNKIIIDKYLSYMIPDDDCNIVLCNLYRDTLSDIAHNMIDARNITDALSDYFASITYIDRGDFILLPLELIIYKLAEKDNYILMNKHKCNSQMNESVIIYVNDLDILDRLSEMGSVGLVDMNKLYSYVRTVSKETLTSTYGLMAHGGSEDFQISDGARKSIQVKTNSLDFSGCKIIDFFNNKGYMDSTYSIDYIEQMLEDDYNRIVEMNKLNRYYIVQFVRAHMYQFKLKTVQVIKGEKSIETLNKAIKKKFNEYLKYHHMLTKLELAWGYMVWFKYNQTKHYNKHICDPAIIAGCDVSAALMDDSIEVDCSIIGLVKFCWRYCSGNASPTTVSNADLRLVEPVPHSQVNHDDASYTNTETKLLEAIGVGIMGLGAESTNDESNPYESISRAIKCLNESFEVKKDGTIKVVLKGTNSLMEEYANNHRLLKLNADNGDVDGMKYNLVYCLMIIESAEKVLHNEKVSKDSSKYLDAEKAKAFANNDIATYLPRVMLYDKKFNLNKFYREVRADKYTIEIDTVSTISGIKKIIDAVSRM